MALNTCTHWMCGGFKLAMDRPRIMGVLNVTPDSFSDGGEHDTCEAAVAHALMMLDQGADIIDVGGESTRPGFTPVSPDEEAQRVVPVVRKLVERGAIVSIDTRHPEVAELCVNLGAAIINDVEGFSNPAMIEVAANSGAGCIIMHAGSCMEDKKPHTHVELEKSRESIDSLNTLMSSSASSYALSSSANDEQVVRNIKGTLLDRARMLEKAGISKNRICIDPGAGFGKTAHEDFAIQKSFRRLSTMGYPVMCALSRKRMTGILKGESTPLERDALTAGMCVGAIEQGANIVRVHNVELVRDVLDGYWTSVHSTEKRSYVALGSNVGNRKGYLQKALEEMNKLPLTKVVAVSHAYDTEPAYGLETTVVDAVCEIKTQLTPLTLLKHLLQIEEGLGRKRLGGSHSGPRTIDLDLLWMEDEVHAGDLLELPHPRMGERDFVLRPMQDLMINPTRFLASQGIDVVDPEFRVGKVTRDLGELSVLKTDSR